MAKAIYTSGSAAKFYTSLTIDDKEVKVQFERGQFVTNDEAVEKALDLAIATSAVGRFVTKASEAAALAVVRQHQQRTGAVQGGVSAFDVHDAMRSQVAEQDAAIAKAALDNPQVVAELDEIGVTVTEPVDPVQKPSMKVGKK